MHQVALFLFAIPATSIVVIAVIQVFDELFKKKFVLERRARTSRGPASDGVQRRRYSDSVPPGTLRNPDTTVSAPAKEAAVPQVHVV